MITRIQVQSSTSMLLLFGLLVALLQPTAATSCVQEFDPCVMPRDCCEGLACVGGDWQYTTDSTYLSPLSAWLEEQHYSMQDRKELLQAFYAKVGTNKSEDQVDHLMKKFRSTFPKLVAKLEQKYQAVFDIPGLPSELVTVLRKDDGGFEL